MYRTKQNHNGKWCIVTAAYGTRAKNEITFVMYASKRCAAIENGYASIGEIIPVRPASAPSAMANGIAGRTATLAGSEMKDSVPML